MKKFLSTKPSLKVSRLPVLLAREPQVRRRRKALRHLATMLRTKRRGKKRRLSLAQILRRMHLEVAALTAEREGTSLDTVDDLPRKIAG